METKCKKCSYVAREDNPVILGFCCITCKKTNGSDHNKNCSKRRFNEIRFYKAEDLYGEFSNFYLRSIVVDGISYPTSEHCYQAQKFPNNPEIVKEIMSTRNPGIVYNIAHHNNKQSARSDWNSTDEPYKNTAMLKALRAKFTQHTDLKQLLLDTKNKVLIEHTYNDKYWGDGGDGKGLNMLGKMLMQVRDELNELSELSE